MTIAGFIELPIWNPPAGAAYKPPVGRAPNVTEHNDYGQGSTLVRLASIAYILPQWESEGELWSHSRIVMTSGGWIDVDASFEQIEEATAKAAPDQSA